MMSNQLRKFLTESKYSLERERLLHLTAIQELKLYAAMNRQKLMVTEPEIDIEGFDFVLSSEFESVHLQSKGTLYKSGRKSWKIRAALIKPSFYNRDLVPDMDGLKVGGFATGATGGVVLHVIDDVAADAGRLAVSYYYLDVYWLIGIASGAGNRPKRRRERALAILRQMRKADDDERLDLRISDFAKLSSVNDIAALRLHIGGISNWMSRCHYNVDLGLLADPNPSLPHWPGRAYF
jgi:hypothetical protein